MEDLPMAKSFQGLSLDCREVTMLVLRKNSKKKRTGFTLIELMVVIAILAILAAILVPILMRARFKTYHAACVQNERNLATALELYALENKQLYPPDLDTLVQPPRPYIASIETCPSTRSSYTTTYTVESDFTGYLQECPGGHEVQLPGVVDDRYPQVANGVINQYNATR
jgi:prepilin-type N-terminal cleavage/methylation domain-containing protein